MVERAVQAVEGQIRVMKLALEDRIGLEVKAGSCIVTFMAEYGAYMMNRLEVGKDGRTPYERVKGKAATLLGVEFGEKLLWRKKAGSKMDKLNPKYEYGIFVGARPRSGELWVATAAGVVKARAVRRIFRELRWSPDSLASGMCRGTDTRTSRMPTARFPRTRPWRPSPWTSRRCRSLGPL